MAGSDENRLRRDPALSGTRNVRLLSNPRYRFLRHSPAQSGYTLAGFTLRATLGTALDVVRARRPLDEAVRNWLAVLSLPAVFLGLKRDPWDPFRDYATADRDHSSTFFLVPFRNQPGVTPEGLVESRRSVAYGVRDIRADVQTLGTARFECAVHGINSWRDAAAGRAEMRELTTVTDQQRTGVRVHWLYFAEDSARVLENAGYDYDSTWGYNDQVGFRAGTLQPFRFPGTVHFSSCPLPSWTRRCSSEIGWASRRNKREFDARQS